MQGGAQSRKRKRVLTTHDVIQGMRYRDSFRGRVRDEEVRGVVVAVEPAESHGTTDDVRVYAVFEEGAEPVEDWVKGVEDEEKPDGDGKAASAVDATAAETPNDDAGHGATGDVEMAEDAERTEGEAGVRDNDSGTAAPGCADTEVAEQPAAAAPGDRQWVLNDLPFSDIEVVDEAWRRVQGGGGDEGDVAMNGAADVAEILTPHVRPWCTADVQRALAADMFPVGEHFRGGLPRIEAVSSRILQRLARVEPVEADARAHNDVHPSDLAAALTAADWSYRNALVRDCWKRRAHLITSDILLPDNRLVVECTALPAALADTTQPLARAGDAPSSAVVAPEADGTGDSGVLHSIPGATGPRFSACGAPPPPLADVYVVHDADFCGRDVYTNRDLRKQYFAARNWVFHKCAARLRAAWDEADHAQDTLPFAPDGLRLGSEIAAYAAAAAVACTAHCVDIDTARVNYERRVCRAVELERALRAGDWEASAEGRVGMSQRARGRAARGAVHHYLVNDEAEVMECAPCGATKLLPYPRDIPLPHTCEGHMRSPPSHDELPVSGGKRGAGYIAKPPTCISVCPVTDDEKSQICGFTHPQFVLAVLLEACLRHEILIDLHVALLQHTQVATLKMRVPYRVYPPPFPHPGREPPRRRRRKRRCGPDPLLSAAAMLTIHTRLPVDRVDWCGTHRGALDKPCGLAEQSADMLVGVTCLRALKLLQGECGVDVEWAAAVDDV